MVNCLILAGNSKEELKSKTNKAFIELNFKPMIVYVIEALKYSKVIDKIAVVGPAKELESLQSFVDIIVDSDDTLLNNVAAGVKYFQNDKMLLISTSDIPFLTGEAVEDFVRKSLDSNADICYPIVQKQTCDDAFPEAKRTYAHLKEGQFTGGNLIMLKPEILDRSLNIARQMIEYRKSPVNMSRVLGLPFLIRLLSGRLSIVEVENRLSRLLNIKGKAIITEYAEIGNDIDKPEDIIMAEKYFGHI